MSERTRRLQQVVNEGVIGSQLSIIGADGTHEILTYGVDATGREIESDSLFATYCAGKPVLVAIILRLVESGELSIDDTLQDLSDVRMHATTGQLTVGDLLCHRGGLSHIDAADVLTVPRQVRRQMLLACESTGRTTSPCYTDEATWSLLQVLIEDLTSSSIEQALEELVTLPLGIERDVFLSSNTRRWEPDRQRINGLAAESQELVTTLSWERSAARLTDAAAGSSVIASTMGLATLLRWTAEAVADLPPHLSSSLGEDQVLRRHCGFRFGLMADLAAHDYSILHSPDSLGHSGLPGSTFAANEPKVGTYAYHEVLIDPAQDPSGTVAKAALRRLRVSESVMDALGAQLS